MTEKVKTFLGIVVFGLAFGFVEAAVVIYLRELIKYNILVFNITQGEVLLNLRFIAFLSPSQPELQDSKFLAVEMFREFSTLLMLGAVAYLSAEKLIKKMAAFLIVFSVWDLSYYLYLKLVIGWPENWWSPDVFFLLPVPWVGPIITPIVISSLLLAIGSYIFLKKQNEA